MEMACRRLLEADEYGRPRLAGLTVASFGQRPAVNERGAAIV
jgi:hypothetical protein